MSSQPNKKPADQSLLILETYPLGESAYDGLTGLFNEVKHLGKVMPETAGITGAKVLVCGIAPLYKDRISPRNINVIFTTFESDQLPDEWVASINQYRHCIVSHPAVKDVFVNSGIRIPITVIHNGYRRYKRRHRTQNQPGNFIIGFLGVPVNRKNLCKLYEACKQLKQTTIPGLRLHIHVASFYDWLDSGPFEEMKADDMVRWTTGKYTPEQISDWYYQLSCYIFPSSGEGWSYTPRESMYLGIPTIISDIPAHRELAMSGFYKMIDTCRKEAADFDGAVHGSWHCIETAAIKNAITDMYMRYGYFSELSKTGAEWIRHKWENEEIGEHLITLMSNL